MEGEEMRTIIILMGISISGLILFGVVLMVVFKLLFGGC